MSDVKYPDCVVELSGVDGNIYNVIAHARTALYRYLTGNKIMLQPEARSQADKMTAEIVEQHSYDEALAVVFRWVTVE